MISICFRSKKGGERSKGKEKKTKMLLLTRHLNEKVNK